MSFDLKTACQAPICTLLCSEPLLLGEALADVRREVLTSAADFNRHEYIAKEASLPLVLDTARTLPMMAKRRFVHLKEIENLKADKQEPLLAYIQKPVASTLFCISGERLDKRSKFSKALEKWPYFQFEVPAQKQLLAWILKRAKTKGLSISTDAAALMAEHLGPKLLMIDTYLGQLALYAANQTIDTNAVLGLIFNSREQTIFELTDSMLARKQPQVLAKLAAQFAQGVHPLVIVTMVARQFRQLLKAKELHYVSEMKAAQELAVPPFVARSLMAYADQFTEEEILRYLTQSSAVELKIKKHGATAELRVSEWLLGMR